MVLSLVDLSLRSITKGIEDGTIQQPHLLPSNLRQRVFDTAFKQSLSNHPNGIDLLTSVEFLNGLTSISANACNDNDLEFLERLVASLATKLPNGETVGAAVKKLNLKVYGYGGRRSNFKNEETYSVIISKLSDLIGHCPNMVSLDLHVNKSGATRGYWPLNENENGACNRAMENLVDLSVRLTEWEDIVDSDRPILNFKQLKTLKLGYCSFHGDTWPNLLEKIPVLENLHLFDVHAHSNGLDWILPSPLPHLKSLEVRGFVQFFECNNAFVDKLMECPQLRQVHLKLDERSTDEDCLIRLANMNIDLKMEVRIDVQHGYDASILDSSSRFKLVRIFHEKMMSFELFVWSKWGPRITAALEDVVDTCSNLTLFGIRNHPQIEFGEKKRVNLALVRYFGNPQRVQQLKGLRLIGNFDEIVVLALFESCLNLVRLEIWDCSALRDQHLIDWVSRGGGKLADFFMSGCNGVTIEGIIPILAKSAEGLLRCQCHGLGQDSGGRNWMTVLRNRCPNVQ